MKVADIRNKSLGELVAENPQVIPVLNKYSLDYCCGGKDSLEKAVKDGGHDESRVFGELEAVLKEKETLSEQYKDWRKASVPEIIDRILQTHHVFMKETLAEANVLMFKVLKAHFRNHGPLLLTIHKLFGTLKTELEAHLVKEEESLFPRILEYDESGDGKVLEDIIVEMQSTEDEHDAAGDLFKELNTVTGGYQVPVDACLSFQRVYELLDALEKDTFNHIHLENSILFEVLKTPLQQD